MLTLAGNWQELRGSRTLFEDVSLSINLGERIALVGPNGAGKSTLFSIILKTTEPDTGTVVLDKHTTLGYLPQETAATGDETVLELATAITPEHAKLKAILSEGDRTGQTDTEAYHEAQGKYAELGAYQLEPKAKRILSGLACRETDFHRPAKTMSGGWIMRAHLARLLVMEPDLLMLDEPTNHLDLESLGWFQNYLTYYPGAILMISHDRAFLNELVDNIFEIRNKQVHRYRGNYDAYVEQRACAAGAAPVAAYKNQRRPKSRNSSSSPTGFAPRRARRRRRRASSSKSSGWKKIEATEGKREAHPHQVSAAGAQRGQRVITLNKIHFAYDTLRVPFIAGSISRSKKASARCWSGRNGAGKSTLLKILGGLLTAQQGESASPATTPRSATSRRTASTCSTRPAPCCRRR